MRKCRSQTEIRYKKLCGRVRRNGGFPFPPKPYQDYDELEEMAILTYDTFDSEFTGWSNPDRRHAFITRRWMVNDPYGLPF